MKQGDKFFQTFLVSEKIYLGFIDLFNDQNPLHTNEHFATKKGFVSKVMHGNILGGFLSYLVGECLPTKDVIIHSQEIKYLNPIYLNDSVNLNAEVNEVFDSVGAIEFKFHFECNNIIVAKGKIQIGII